MAALDDFSWLGISLVGHPASLVGKFTGRRCVVVATAKCVWDDLARLGVRGDQNNDWHVMCINDISMHYPGVVNHLYSNQARWIPHWCNARRETINCIKVRDVWGHIGMTHSCNAGAKYHWPWPGHGTSTLNGVYTALALGYNPVVLCGAPLDDSPHYFEPEWCRSNFTREVGTSTQGRMMHWAKAATHIFNGRVKSMSGRTMELLGGFGA